MSYFRAKTASWVNTAGGAIVGAGAGALGGKALTKDEANTQRNMIGGAIAGGLAGGGLGYGGPVLIKKLKGVGKEAVPSASKSAPASKVTAKEVKENTSKAAEVVSSSKPKKKPDGAFVWQ